MRSLVLKRAKIFVQSRREQEEQVSLVSLDELMKDGQEDFVGSSLRCRLVSVCECRQEEWM